VTRAEKRHYDRENKDCETERQPVSFEFAHLSGWCHCLDYGCRQADAGPPAKHGYLRGKQPEHLRHHPSANRKIGSAQTKDQCGDRDCHQCADHARNWDGRDWVDIQQHRKREQQISAEPDKGLLSNGHQTGVSREQIPQTCQGDKREHLGQKPQCLPVAPIWRKR
jgi:hypothetical protein